MRDAQSVAKVTLLTFFEATESFFRMVFTVQSWEWPNVPAFPAGLVFHSLLLFKKSQYSEFRKNDIALVFGWFSQAIFVVTSAPMKIHILS